MPYADSIGQELIQHLLMMAHIPRHERRMAAGYLEKCISPAVEQKVPAARQIMAWFQRVAEVLAVADIPLRWETPTGNTIEQSYWDHTKTRVATLAGRVGQSAR